MSIQGNAHRSIQVLNSQVFPLKATVSTSTYDASSSFFQRTRPNFAGTTILTMTSNTRSRRRAQYSLDLEQTASVSNVVANMAAVLVDVTVRRHHLQRKMTDQGSAPRRRFRQRTRRSIQDIHKELGKMYFRRAYRMTYTNFKRLAALLCPYINAACSKKGTSRFYWNGRISPDVRLACAIRWFAGGSPYDIMTTYGISHTDTINSFWYVIDAINRHPHFTIVYPDNQDQQRSIAEGFAAVSAAGIKCCAGAIDGILIWIHKPPPTDCVSSGCSSGKFFCGRKKKFGLNCQAVCDVRGRILDISIQYPGSTLDCLAFKGMSLFQRLEQGILDPSLCIFGDNAYLNTPYMATPYAAVSGGTKDAYNFYHSQLRIRIECAFGMLTHRWAILRSAIPMNVSVKKTVALVLALAKLHNYCIENDVSQCDVSYNSAADKWQNEVNGAVPLVETQHAESSRDVTPRQLLDGGHHFDDIGMNGRYNRQRRYNYGSQTGGIALPRDRLHTFVASTGLTRPVLQPNR